MQVTLTEEEGQQIVTLFDAAVKASGLQAALVAVPLFYKLQAAANEPTEEVEIS